MGPEWNDTACSVHLPATEALPAILNTTLQSRNAIHRIEQQYQIPDNPLLQLQTLHQQPLMPFPAAAAPSSLPAIQPVPDYKCKQPKKGWIITPEMQRTKLPYSPGGWHLLYAIFEEMISSL